MKLLDTHGPHAVLIRYVVVVEKDGRGGGGDKAMRGFEEYIHKNNVYQDGIEWKRQGSQV